MALIGYTVAADVEPFLLRWLRGKVAGVAFKLDAPSEQTTTPAQPTCYIYTQTRQQASRVTDNATIGLAYYQGASETVTQATVAQAKIIGLLSSDAVCLADGSPIVMPILDEVLEFTLAELKTAAHAKPVYYAAVPFVVQRTVETVEV